MIAKKSTKRHNKQHDARAASFKRIAKSKRLEAKRFRQRGSDFFHEARALEASARCDDQEAKLLRSMR